MKIDQKLIFPNISIDHWPTDKYYFVTARTWIRKLHTDGKWYLFFEKATVKTMDTGRITESIIEATQKLLRIAYYHEKALTIPQDFIDCDDTALCKIDPNQQSEADYLIDLEKDIMENDLTTH